MSERVADPRYPYLLAAIDKISRVPWPKEDTRWMQQGKCVQHPPEWWDLDSMVRMKDLGPEKNRDALKAKAICYTCPMITTCFGFAVKYEILTGIWGGYDPGQRHGYKIAVTAKRNARKRQEAAACTS